jgi:hypothetical protein
VIGRILNEGKMIPLSPLPTDSIVRLNLVQMTVRYPSGEAQVVAQLLFVR